MVVLVLHLRGVEYLSFLYSLGLFQTQLMSDEAAVPLVNAVLCTLVAMKKSLCSEESG